jgi:hypothetical protein
VQLVTSAPILIRGIIKELKVRIKAVAAIIARIAIAVPPVTQIGVGLIKAVLLAVATDVARPVSGKSAKFGSTRWRISSQHIEQE